MSCCHHRPNPPLRDCAEDYTNADQSVDLSGYNYSETLHGWVAPDADFGDNPTVYFQDKEGHTVGVPVQTLMGPDADPADANMQLSPPGVKGIVEQSPWNYVAPVLPGTKGRPDPVPSGNGT